MNGTPKDLAEEYAAAMQDYLAGRGEAALRRAYEVGRRALAQGVGVLEMAAAHQKAVMAALGNQFGEQGEQALVRALNCFAESLSPFEMVLRGVQEANTRLQQSLGDLQRIEDQLRRQNENLTAAHHAVEKERYRYQALFDFAPDGYLVTDFDGSIREANTAAAVLLGTPKHAMPGRSLIDFVVEDTRDSFSEQLRALRMGTLDKIEDWQIAIKPKNRPATPTAITVAAERGDPATGSLRWLIRDVTERKRLEAERARSLVGHAKAEASRRFQFLAEASSLLVGSLDVEASLVSVAHLAVPYLAAWCFIDLVDADGALRQLEVVHADPSAAELAKELKRHCLFRPRTPTRGDLGTITASPYIVSQVSDSWCEKVADGPAHAALLRVLRGCSAVVVPLQIHERILGVLTFVSAPSSRRYQPADLALCEDLAHRCALALENARLYHEVTAERDKAERASRAKDEFLAILNHELRNPLMPVIGWTRMLKNHALISQDPILAEGVSSMERNAQTLARLVDDCLDLARISEGKIRMERKLIDLNQIVLASVEAVREMAAAKQLQLTTELWPKPVPLFGDSIRLEQVVMNLLVNAVKYTETSGVISIRSLLVDGEAAVEVRDTGTGIHPAFLEQIFQPFRQGTHAWLTSQSGLGLGLAIARQIVEMHAGKIWAESKGLDFGSTFHVRLPAAEGQPMTGELDRDKLRDADRSRAVRILLIEDSEDVLFLMKMELELMGHAVLTALDGVRGLQLAKTFRPDLIISDIKMPGMDGYEFIREVRTTPELCSIPAIALTGFGGKAVVDRSTAAGFDACVSKPADPQVIAELIKQLIKKRNVVQAEHIV
jgi:PAS domain S-box-containing protein